VCSLRKEVDVCIEDDVLVAISPERFPDLWAGEAVCEHDWDLFRALADQRECCSVVFVQVCNGFGSLSEE